MDPLAEIKKIYYAATKGTIEKDLDRAIDLLKTLPSEEERDKVAVYMDGLAQMKTEWKQAVRGGVGSNVSRRTTASARPAATPRGRSGPSTTSSRRTR